MIVIILIFFLIGLYLYVNRKTQTCPTVLIQHGKEIWLQDSLGSEPIVFQSLEEYKKYAEQHDSCPVLELQKVYNAQNEPEYRIPVTLVDATRGHSPYNDNMYPGMDPHNQTIGEYTVLDVIKI